MFFFFTLITAGQIQIAEADFKKLISFILQRIITVLAELPGQRPKKISMPNQSNKFAMLSLSAARLLESLTGAVDTFGKKTCASINSNFYKLWQLIFFFLLLRISWIGVFVYKCVENIQFSSNCCPNTNLHCTFEFIYVNQFSYPNSTSNLIIIKSSFNFFVFWRKSFSNIFF